MVNHQQLDVAAAEIRHEAADVTAALEISGTDIEARRQTALIAQPAEKTDRGALRRRDRVIADRRLETVGALEFEVKHGKRRRRAAVAFERGVALGDCHRRDKEAVAA